MAFTCSGEIELGPALSLVYLTQCTNSLLDEVLCIDSLGMKNYQAENH